MEMRKGAVISECKLYRYKLWRIWNDELPKVLFIMLNPSTADANKDDPTIRKCIKYAKSWGYGGLYVGNLFAFRATKPKDLTGVDNPFGDFNNIYLNEMSSECNVAVCAWGNYDVLKRLKYTPELDSVNVPLYYIEKSINGTPKHPLYLKSDLSPKKMIEVSVKP